MKGQSRREGQLEENEEEEGSASLFHFLALRVTKAKIPPAILLKHYNVFKPKFQI